MATPSALWVVPLVALAAGAVSGVYPTASRRARWLAVSAFVFAFGPALFSETTTYKLGLVLVLLVAVSGLHLLVNWVGELSLAHAAMVGLPAFVVAKISAEHNVSPVVLLPVAVLVGLVGGGVVGVPAIRARGLQVALVTLACGVAIDRFFFTKEWLVGSVSGARVPTPSLGPLELRTARGMYPVLAVVVLAAIAAAWALYRSKYGRAFLWIKAHPDAAAAFGVPVARYRTLAYVLAGGFAGLSGGLTTMWVQRLTPAAFPLSRSFTMLIIVALAGRGFIGGVAAAAAMVEGGRLFLASGDAFITYAAPAGLLFTLTRHPTGLNGLGRRATQQLRGGLMPKFVFRPLLAAGAACIAVGFASIGLAWYHSGNTAQVWIQNQEMILGGMGGLALVMVGLCLSTYDRLLAARALEAQRWTELLDVMKAREEDAATRRPRRMKAS